MKVLKNPQTIAREVLLAEADALRQAVDRLDDQFDRCVELILAAGGRVVVTGVGKSALVGQKIVATLNSTGTPALFMHAADAIHGDLGMIQSTDVVVGISKSGNTPEIRVLVPLLRQTGARLIALVSERDSYLAQQADWVLHAYAAREADPLNLAPTTSTTVAMAIGDALAIALLDARGFTRQDFARFHPGGSLGKKLYLKVADIFPHNPCPTVQLDTSLKDVLLEISAKRLGATAVLTDDGRLAGIVTDGDVRRMLNHYEADLTDHWPGPGLHHLLAADILTRHPVCVAPDDYAVSALQTMQERNITQVIVVDNDRPVGFVHLHDLLREGLL